VTERKRTKAEERSYAALRDALTDLELDELERWNAYRKLKEKMIPGAWHGIEREVPVRPKKIRVTAAFDEAVVKWFRAMGHNHQARMNAVLKAYMLAVQSREIQSRANRDWKGDEI
jgi:uncharacterized protein (DUF4415 family)